MGKNADCFSQLEKTLVDLRPFIKQLPNLCYRIVERLRI